MKIVCGVRVGNRLLPVLSVKPQSRHIQSTLALCKNPKSNDYCIIHFTNQNKTGTKYNLRNNITQILTKFIHDGKATIQFKQPPHDLYVQADVIQLKGFLHLVKRALENKIDPKERLHSTMAVTPVATKDLPKKVMHITSRAQYSSRGFPKTLEVLRINDIGRCSFDQGILQLMRLKVLDLSQNLIEFVPERLNQLPNLCELNLSGNCLGRATLRQWNWMGGKLSCTLRSLNLDNNSLKYLPNQIAKLRNLETFSVRNNQLTCLPDGIGILKQLRVLNVENNSISIFPGSIRQVRLNMFNFSHNRFESHHNSATPAATNTAPKSLPVLTLKECAGRKVLQLKINYTSSMIPATLVDYLDYAKFCGICGSACFNVFIRDTRDINSNFIASNLVTNTTTILPLDCYFCSLYCFKSFTMRARHPVIR